ncbi:MAG TPA: lysylphosphatidylglycerol synthase transmembrane domain-containing protein, partial [Acidimicrobiales bacterium]|nr:lysylphosphatidylglycerol synthase transmembrane domain-containing protein [Acidimicrobiales bacterium]
QRPPRTWKKWVKDGFTVAVVALAVWGTYEHRSEISHAGGMLSHLHVAWLLVAIAFEIASMAAFARLQRWLLRAGGVKVPFLPMLEITLAGNAMSTSLPGGAAWSATWAFEQLRRRGAEKILAGWVILVAGALSSFAVFVIVAGGAWVAGSHGPVSHLRWVAAALAAIPLLVAAGYVAARRSNRARQLLSGSWRIISAHVPPARALGNLVHKTVNSLGLVHPGPLGWVEAFAYALANWLCDCLCLIACMEALGVPVPWRGILVVYGLTQVAASIPITPGGIGVVEGSMTALLIAYGTQPTSAVAVVLLYRIVSFWGLAPIGWTAWLGIELAIRRGVRHRPHPWAEHDHGPEPPAATPAGPERVLSTSLCSACVNGAEPLDGSQQASLPEKPNTPLRER